MLVHALVVSKIDYCKALYEGLSMRLLQKIQNMAARLLSEVHKYQHISLVLAALHWLPAHFHASFKEWFQPTKP